MISGILTVFVWNIYFWGQKHLQNSGGRRGCGLGGNVGTSDGLQAPCAAPSDVGAGMLSRPFGSFAFVSELSDARKC